MIINYKNEIKKCLNDFKSIKTVYKQIPNILTVIRAVGIIPVNILYFTGNIIPAIIMCVVMFLSDFFDGKIARKYNIISEFGAKLDAVCDKVMFIGLSIPLLCNKLLLIVNLLFEMCIGGINVLNEKKGYDPKTVLSGKIKTWMLFITLGMGYLSLVLNVMPIIFILLVMGTGIIQGFTLCEYIKYYKNSKNKEEENIHKDTCNKALEDDKEYYIEKFYVYSKSNSNKSGKVRKKVKE